MSTAQLGEPDAVFSVKIGFRFGDGWRGRSKYQVVGSGSEVSGYRSGVDEFRCGHRVVCPGGLIDGGEMVTEGSSN